MKNLSVKLRRCIRLLSIAVVCLPICSCNLLGSISGNEGILRVSFAPEQEILTRSGIEIPDTSDFILTVKDSKGTVMYEGPFGASPRLCHSSPEVIP